MTRSKEKKPMTTVLERTEPLAPPEADDTVPAIMADIQPPSAMETLFERAVCLTLSLKRPGNHRRLSTALVEVDADKELISARKTLLHSEHLTNIVRLDGEVRRFLYSRGLPSMFRDGIYLVPVPLVEEAEVRLAQFKVQRRELAEAFADAYPMLIEQAQGRLRKAYNPADYPPVEEVRQAFTMEWQYVEFSVPGSLNIVSRELFCAAREKAERQWTEALDEVRILLRTNLSDMVSHLVERLTPGADGKMKVFKRSVVGNMTEFLQLFDARNLSDDRALASVVEQARRLLTDVEPEEIRASKRTRQSLRDGFTELKATLDGLVTERPMRAFHFDE